VQPGQRHLGGPDEVEVVVRGGEDLLLVGGEEPRAVHRLLADEDRRHHRGVAVLHRDVEGVADQCELEQRSLALEVGEPRSGDLGRAGEVDRTPLEEVDVVTGLGDVGLLPDRAQDHAVAFVPVRRVRLGQVRDGPHGPVEGLVGVRQLGLDARSPSA
jgi:hypothetical protein